LYHVILLFFKNQLPVLLKKHIFWRTVYLSAHILQYITRRSGG